MSKELIMKELNDIRMLTCCSKPKEFVPGGRITNRNVFAKLSKPLTAHKVIEKRATRSGKAYAVVIRF